MESEANKRELLAFLFTDIEGSTQRWERFPDSMDLVVARHDQLLAGVVEETGGSVVAHTGDGLIASFTDTNDAIRAAVQAQAAIASGDWDAVDGLAIRIAVHRGEIVRRDGQPWGWALNFASRLNSLGHGGQILISEAALESVGGLLPPPLGLRPLGEHRLRDIAQPARVFQVDPPGSTTSFDPLRNTTRLRSLPAPIKSVVGRGSDVSEGVAAATSHRVVTVVGPTGVGTSTLAVEVARRLAPDFEDKVHRCDLLGVSASAALESIATTLGVNIRPRQTVDESIASWVDQQKLLLIIDHCAPAIEAVARLVEVLLRSTPHCTIICASTQVLGVEGEFQQHLLPLSQDAAVELFRERAAAVGATVADSEELRTLCDQLDRIPLALEVAASNAAVATVPELGTFLADRQLQASSTAGAGMQSIRDAVSVSLDGLEASQLSMLRTSTVFAGPFDRAAFRRVCCPTASDVEANAALGAFLERSLMTVDNATGQPLFRCFESVVDVLGPETDADELRQANARFVEAMIDFANVSAEELRGSGELLAGRRVNAQLRNLRAAFDLALSTADLRSAALISTSLWEFGFMRMSDEYFRWSERLVATFTMGDETLLGPVLGVAALGAWVRDDVGSALEWSTRALRLEAEHGLDFDLPARHALINATVYSGASTAPPEVFEASANYQRSRPETYFHVNVESLISIMATWQGNTDAAVRRGVRAVRLARESENPSSLSFALWALGSALDENDPSQAVALLGEALELARNVGNQWVAAIAQMSLASVQRRHGASLDAAAILLDLIDVLWRAGHRSHLWATLRLAALTLADLGDRESAIRLHSSVSDSHLAMPAVPADAAAWGHLMQDALDAEGSEWVEKKTLITSTWTTKVCVDAARTALRAKVLAA